MVRMATRQWNWLPAVAVAMFLFPRTSAAQLGGQFENGTISGTGVVEIKRPSDVLRMTVQVIVKGKDLKEALAKLKERRTTLAKQLETLGAIKDSISLGEPQLDAGRSASQRRMEMLVTQRMRQSGKGTKKPKAVLPTTVTLSLTAEWPLAGTGSEERLLAAHDIQEKIKAADVGGLKESEKLTPEEEELQEEMQDQFNFGMDQDAKPGEPVFVYISRVSPQDREKAVSEAFRKAKDEAAALARAAGEQLGELRSLSSSNQSLTGLDGLGYESNPALYRYMQQATVLNQHGTAGSEAVGASPGAVTYAVTVYAAFQVKPDNGK